VNHWWRAYNEAVNDPKLQLLSDALFRAWFNVMCIASANGGELPSLKDIAFTLRVPPAKAAQVLAQLNVAGLLDKTETGFVPHNWNGRQYKVDAIDPTAASRSKRYRDKRRDASRSNTVTDTVTQTVTVKRPESDTEQIAVAADARAKAPLIGPDALALAEQLLRLAGHDPSFWPPAWCGAPMRVQTWLSQGWQPEIIASAVKSVMAKRQGKQVSSVQFFENAIAEEHARQAAPLPIVEVREAQTLVVTTNGKPKSAVIQAADNLVQRIASFDDAGGSDGLRGDQGEASPRLLSHG
jgi:hypothetical protein